MVDKREFYFKDSKGQEIHAYRWFPEGAVKAIVQISHGMAETAARYERFGEFLTSQGYGVYVNDHRGHGKTAKSVENLGYMGEGDAFEDMVQDMYELNEVIHEENDGLKVFLFGHSMGSFLSQRYLQIHGKSIDGMILSGTNGKQGIIVDFGRLISKMEMKKKGPKAQSERMNSLSFGGYNRVFKPCRTDFDWLTRDEKEVDKYVADEFCGTVFTTSFYYYFLTGLKNLYKNENLKHVPRDIPILIFAGAKDPVGNSGKGILKLYNMYKELKVDHVNYKLYREGRHEMLNELNREEVMNDVLEWLEMHLN